MHLTKFFIADTSWLCISCGVTFAFCALMFAAACALRLLREHDRGAPAVGRHPRLLGTRNFFLPRGMK
jgi:hypothetical protein